MNWSPEPFICPTQPVHKATSSKAFREIDVVIVVEFRAFEEGEMVAGMIGDRRDSNAEEPDENRGRICDCHNWAGNCRQHVGDQVF